MKIVDFQNACPWHFTGPKLVWDKKSIFFWIQKTLQTAICPSFAYFGFWKFVISYLDFWIYVVRMT